MSDKEKDIMKRISSVIPMLDKEKQNYILGLTEGMAITREEIEGGKEKELQ